MKRILALILALIMSLSLVACGGGSDKDTSTDAGTDAGDAASVEEVSLDANDVTTESGRPALTMWFWGAATDYQVAMKDILCGWYNNSQDDYELVIEFRNTVDVDIPRALAAGTAPDIIYASGPSYIGTYKDEDLVLNLDSDRTTNFSVFNENTLLAKSGDGEIQITDNGNGTYTIENADERFLAMQPGDTFAYTYPDGKVLIVNAASVSVSGTTITVTDNPDADLSMVFDFVKIEEDSNDKAYTYDDSTLSDGLTVISDEELVALVKQYAPELHARYRRFRRED